MSANTAFARASEEWIPAENHHRIANSLSMIAALVRVQANAVGQGGPVSADQARQMLEETAARIEAAARLHRLLTSAPGETPPVGEYFRDICMLAQRAFDKEERVSITCDFADELSLETSRLAALGLLVNEAIINALKYAHPSGVAGHVALSCRPIFGDSLLISIEDDGVGLPPRIDADRGGGMGFRIMRALATQLDAKLTCRTSALGLTLQVLLPV